MFRNSLFNDGKTVVLAALLCFSNANASGQETDKAKIRKELETKIAEVCSKHKVPSISVAAVSSSETLITACSGVRKRGAAGKTELTDLRPLGSNTKSMTATLAAIIVESGKIDWDTTISEVWPKLDSKYLHPKLRECTLDDLLSHQSGLRKDFGGKAWASFFSEEASPAAERRRMLKLCMKDKPKYKRGEYHYSNLGYVVAAAMLEAVTKEDFETMMRRDVFKPLGINSADFRTMRTAKKLKQPLLWGHQSNGKPISPKVAGADNPSVYSSVGTVHLTIDDYAKYARWHLSERPEPLLSKQESVDHLHTGIVTIASGDSKYGGGWIHFKSGFGRTMQHTGTNTNSFALIWVLPEKDLAAIACTNTFEEAHFVACDEMIAELFRRYIN